MSDYKGGGRGDRGDRGFNPNGSGGLVVRVYDNNIERAISQLKKRVNTDGVLKELRARECFVPNTLKRRMKMAEARIREKRRQKNEPF